MTAEQFTTDYARWQAVVESNPDADGVFYYAVITTGIYCRPSCSSKLPRCENVQYFQSCEAAEKAGYRPCKRCAPSAIPRARQTEEKIIRACRIIEESEAPINLSDLAAQVHLSPYHFHRLFKKIIGITPKQYGANQQAQRFRKGLRDEASITEALYSAGFGSSGSVYDRNRDQLAMKPKVYRRGAQGVTLYYGLAHCFLGWVIVAATGRGVCAIEFGDDAKSLPRQLQSSFPKAQLVKADSGFAAVVREVVGAIENPERSIGIPLDIQGTAFQQQVWQLLREIRPGETLSYTEVAERLGRPGAVRAVASAIASNRLAVLIPCHRVISKDGKVGRYRWGADRKTRLLQSERDKKV